MRYKFGVEIEFNNLSWTRAEQALVAGGLPMAHRRPGRYDHNNIGQWRLVRDTSVNSGQELVSPPLQGDEGLRQVRLACRTLRNAGARVDRSCGIHVHIDAASFNIGEIKHILKRYVKFEHDIDAFMPRSRRDGEYCMQMRQRFANRIENFNNMDNFRATSRFYKVNAQAYLRHGTVEFRQHSGSLSGYKVCCWVRFVQNFVQKSIEQYHRLQNQAQPAQTSFVQQVESFRTINIRLNGRQERMVNLLRQAAASITELADVSGYSQNSVIANISAIRRHGYTIQKNRHTGRYVLIEEPQPHVAPSNTSISQNAPNLSPKQLKIVRLLETGPKMKATLAVEIGLSAGSVASYISGLRTRGYRIRFRQGRYELLHTPFSHHVQTQPTPRTQGVEIPLNDNVFDGLSPSIVSYYMERQEELRA